MKVLLIDNYDSFTYNLYQYLRHFVKDVDVYKNDCIDLEQISRLNPDKIVISPGPGRPEDGGISLSVVRSFAESKSILGVCLGHQVIAQSFGAKIVMSTNPVHGKSAQISHDKIGIYRGLPEKFRVALYHSLIVEEKSLPEEFIATSRYQDKIIMGIRHKRYRLTGIQFHPESILTEYGYEMVENWLNEK